MPILLFVVAAVAIYAVVLWKKVAKLEENLSGEARLLEDKRGELERARKEAKEKKDELEETRRHLQEAKAKLKKRETKETDRETSGSKKQSKAEEAAGPTLAPIVVRVTDQELSAQHGVTVERLEGEIEALKSQLQEITRRDEAMKREAERAANAMKAAAAGEAARAESTPGENKKQPEDEIKALKAQLEVMTRAAIENERGLKKELRRTDDNARQALRRAANNAQLYAVIKGQLELTEDRLASYRLKYENAKSIDDLKKESRKDRGPKRERRDRRPGSDRGRPDSRAGEAGEAQVVEESVAQGEQVARHDEPRHDEPRHDEPRHDEPTHVEPAAAEAHGSEERVEHTDTNENVVQSS